MHTQSLSGDMEDIFITVEGGNTGVQKCTCCNRLFTYGTIKSSFGDGILRIDSGIAAKNTNEFKFDARFRFQCPFCSSVKTEYIMEPEKLFLPEGIKEEHGEEITVIANMKSEYNDFIHVIGDILLSNL